MTDFEPMDDFTEQFWDDLGRQLAAEGVGLTLQRTNPADDGSGFGPDHVTSNVPWALRDWQGVTAPQTIRNNAPRSDNVDNATITNLGQENIHLLNITTANDIYQLPAAQSSTFHPDANNNHVCPICFASYKIKGDLARHQREKHSTQEYLCPIDRCPRGIEGEGFARNDQLVKHLTTKKHNMDRTDAAYLVRQHNKPKGKKRE